MNRKNKIIVSIIGITIVLLALLGLTYGYYLTRTQGNTNTSSISVTTADLRLVYADGSANVVETNIEPSDEEYTKVFTVTNEGNVNIDYGVYLVDVINTFVRKDDIKYTLECTTTGTIACNQVISETTFPSGISELTTATIEPNKVHTYTFKFTYKDTGTDQSVDMGKELKAKVQIYAENNKGVIVPFDNETLAYNIVNNASNSLNGTTLVLDGSVESRVANEISGQEYGKNNPKNYNDVILDANYSYLVYACDYSIDDSGNISLIETDGCPIKSTTNTYDVNDKELINDLKGKFAARFWTSETSNTNLSGLFKISEKDEDFKTDRIGAASVSKYVSSEKIVVTTEDEYGTSYYYRGGTENNYINFAGMCWRIVRIAGDGSIKLILEDQNELCNENINRDWNIPNSEEEGASTTGNFGYNNSPSLINYLNLDGQAVGYNTSIATAFNNFQKNKLNNYLDKLKSGDWCIADNAYASSNVDITETIPLTDKEKEEIVKSDDIFNSRYFYDSYVRLYGNTTKTPTLKCNGTNMSKWNDNTEMYVGTLTADEITYAGGTTTNSNSNYYLMNNPKSFWVLSPNRYFLGGGELVFYLDNYGRLQEEPAACHIETDLICLSFRPSINLKNNITISDGVGTIDDPYIIN